jgi:hypothetical protein
MSTGEESARLALLSEKAQRTRTLLKQDIQALVFKVSPENLKREAMDVTREVAGEAKAAVVRLGVRAKTFAVTYGVASALTLGVGGLLYAAVSSRRKPLLLACAALCGTAAVMSARKARGPSVLLSTSARRAPALPSTSRVVDVS